MIERQLVISGSRHYLNTAYKPLLSKPHVHHEVISSYQTLQQKKGKILKCTFVYTVIGLTDMKMFFENSF